MISIEEAIEKVRSTLSDDMDVMLDNIIEKEYGWVLFPQSKTYIETKDPMSMVFCSGGILVEKATGKLCELGSFYSTEENLRIYELGYFQYENCDIEVMKVINESKTIEHLSKLRIKYVVPEEECEIVWKIPTEYTVEQLRTKLRLLPARFNLGNAYCIWEEMELLKTQCDFEYRLCENEGHENSI